MLHQMGGSAPADHSDTRHQVQAIRAKECMQGECPTIASLSCWATLRDTDEIKEITRLGAKRIVRKFYVHTEGLLTESGWQRKRCVIGRQRRCRGTLGLEALRVPMPGPIPAHCRSANLVCFDATKGVALLQVPNIPGGDRVPLTALLHGRGTNGPLRLGKAVTSLYGM